MKRNLAKILVLALSLTLLVGAVIGLSVNAEEYTYEIKSMNIAHGDTTVVLVAVDAPATGTAPEGVAVTYVDANGETLTAKYYGDLSVYGTTYPIFYTKGIPAKDLGQDIVATVTVNGEAKDSENVSVAEYLYGKLYKEEYIKATNGKDLNKKNLYLNLLDYAASAETVLWNDKDANADDQRVLITDKFYVYAEGQIEDVLEPNETFTLNYAGTAPEGYTYSGYWVSNIGGNSVVKDGVATKPNAHAVYTPAFYANEEVAGKYYNSETVGARYDFAEGFNNTVYSADNPDGDLAADLIADSTNSFAAGKATLATVDDALVFDMNTSTWVGFTLSNKGNNTGKKFVAEFDFTYNGGSQYSTPSKSEELPFWIGLTKCDENNGNYLLGGNQSQYFDNYNGIILYGVPMLKGNSYNIRIVYDVAGTYEVYVDDVCTYTVTFAAKDAVNTFAGLGIYVRQRHAGNTFSFSLDNVYIGALDGSYFADKTIEGTRYDFADEFNLSAYDPVNNPNGLLTKDFVSGDDSDKAFNTDKNVTLDNSTGALVLDMSKSDFVGITIANKGDTSGSDGDKYIFEADFTWMGYKPSTSTSTSWSGGPFGIGFTSSSFMLNDMFAYNYVTYPNSDSSIPDAKESGHKNLKYGTGVLNLNQTHKIRLEYTVGSEKNKGTTAIYIDDVLVETSRNVGTASDDSSFLGVAIYVRGRHAGTDFTFSLDNVFMTIVKEQ